MSEHNVYRDGKIHVMSAKCSTCIYRPGNLMRLAEGRKESMERDAVDSDGMIPCHQTLVEYDGVGDNAICRGFFDTQWRNIVALRLARVMGIIEFVSERFGTVYGKDKE